MATDTLKEVFREVLKEVNASQPCRAACAGRVHGRVHASGARAKKEIAKPNTETQERAETQEKRPGPEGPGWELESAAEGGVR